MSSPPCEADVLLEISMLEPRDNSTQLTHERAQNVCACSLDFSDSWWRKITLADRAPPITQAVQGIHCNGRGREETKDKLLHSWA